MKLTEIESPSEMIRKAIADGCETVAQYEHWLNGYVTGTRDTIHDATQSIKEESIGALPEFEKHSTAKQREEELYEAQIAKKEEQEHYSDYSDQEGTDGK